ncbi:MAG TPA: radical SAM protein [Deltaproteobacteria bacterium]|nr:radical SAM protein [Deltaproteobacteria bacterium]
MKVLFVYPNISGHEAPHQGLMALSGYLKQAGHETALVDFTFGDSQVRQLTRAVKFNPDMVAFTSTSGLFRFSVEFAGLLKERLKVPIIFGGSHATIAPDKVIAQDAIDMLCINEGEEAMAELLSRIEAGEDYRDIRNLWVKKDGQVYRNPVRPLIADLDSLPYPDFDLFDMERYLSVRNGTFHMITSRGCPFPCSYCINFELQRIQGQKGKDYLRKHSVDYIIGLISYVKARYPINMLAFEDDLFTMFEDWLSDFADKYRNAFPGLPFYCNHRIGNKDEKVFRYLKDAGCVHVQMGIEAGDEYIRKNVLKRYMSDEQIIRSFELAREMGLSRSSYNIIGSPHETIDQIRKTISLNERVQPDDMGISIFCPYPGTKLYKLCIEEGLIEPDFEVPCQHRSVVVLNYPEEKKRQIKKMKKIFRYEVYKRHNLRKALIFLFFDSFYDVFAAVRRKIPMGLKTTLHQIYAALTSH